MAEKELEALMWKVMGAGRHELKRTRRSGDKAIETWVFLRRTKK